MKLIPGNRTSRRIVATYLLVSLVPLFFLSTALLLEVNHARRVSLLDQYGKSLESAGAGFDRIIDRIEAISTHFSTQYTNGTLDSPEALQRQFTAYKESFSLSGDLFFYRRGEQRIWSAEGILDYPTFENSYGFGEELNMASFFSRLNTVLSASCFLSRGYDGLSHYFIYMQPVPILSNTPQGALIYILPSEDIRTTLLDALNLFEGCLSVYTADHRNIYLLNEQFPGSAETVAQSLNRLRGTEWQQLTLDAQKCEVLRWVSDKRGYVYAVAIPEDWLFKELNRNLMIYGLLLFLVAVVTTLIALLVARKQYQPVRQLAQSLHIEENPKDADNGLFETINASLTEIRNENEKLVLQMHSYTREARSRFLTDLVEGKLSRPESITLAMRASGIEFTAAYFCVMVFHVTGMGGKEQDEGPEPYFEEVDFQEGKACSLPVDAENRLALLVNASVQDPDSLMQIADQFRARILRLGFGSPEGMGISRVRTDMMRVNRQLFEAYIALENQTGFYSLGSGESLREELQESLLFRQSLLYGNALSVKRNLEHILNIADREHWALDHRQALYFRLLHSLLVVSVEQNIPVDASELMPLASAAHRDSFEQALLRRAEALCAEMAAKKESKEQVLNQQVIEYIYEHFRENELSLSMVADAFHLSESSLRKVIHEATGTTFSNYISTLRIAYVKKQLAETELPVKMIAENAGYLDVSSFTRKFRTSEGVTPGQYRATIRGEDTTE